MTYESFLQKLYTINLHNGIKFGLKNSLLLNKLLGSPDKKFKSIHIAGTNGKGSVAFKIASGLQHAGYKTGLFTSPHISTFRERIRINDTLISENEVVIGLKKIFSLIESHTIPATFFEITTMLALNYFATNKVDFVVLETGLGGRLDTTNIVTPTLSVITTIDFDHTEFLGDSLDQISYEKAGIIKPKIPVVVGPKASSVLKYTHKLTYYVQSNFENYEEENSAIAKQALDLLNVSPEITKKCIQAKPPCRFEVIKTRQKQHIVFDVAHNPSALESLYQVCQKKFPKMKKRLIFGLSKNKELTDCLKIVSKLANSVHIVQTSNGRGFDAHIIFDHLQNFNKDIHMHKNVVDGMLDALKKCDPKNEIIIVTGSFFIMHEAKKIIKNQNFKNEIHLNESFKLKKENGL